MSAPVTTDRPASGSVAVRDLVLGRSQPLSVLAVFPRAVYLASTPVDAAPRVVLTLVTRDGVAHPGSLVLTAPAAARPFATLGPGDTVEVGRGRVHDGRTVVRVTRWWRARPALAPTAASDLRARSRRLRAVVSALASPPADAALGGADLTVRLGDLVAALRQGHGLAARTAAAALLGRGPGLTPGGDDLLAGLLAGVPLLAAAVDDAGPDGGDAARPGGDGAIRRDLVAATTQLGHHVVRHAPDATTAISASLLRHAVAGEVAAPAATVLHALTGRAEPIAAAAALLAIGATSGRELATGLLAAADLVVDGATAAGPAAARPDRRSIHADAPPDAALGAATRRTD